VEEVCEKSLPDRLRRRFRRASKPLPSGDGMGWVEIFQTPKNGWNGVECSPKNQQKHANPVVSWVLNFDITSQPLAAWAKQGLNGSRSLPLQG